MKELTRKKYIILLLTIVLFMTIGFAVLSTSLTINGNASINSSGWNVKFQNIQLDSSNNVTATTSPSISDNTNISFSVALSSPGDKYSFTVDVVNTGSIDAMIDTINKSTLTTDQAKLVDYSVIYSNDYPISQKDKLVKTNGSATIKIIVDYKTTVTGDDLPSSALNLNLSFGLTYVQADSTANVLTDNGSLDAFIKKTKVGDAISRDIGTTFTVNLGTTYGEHTLRVANVSTPSECSGADFSQTACGVVLEFADIITEYGMGEDNKGGWPATGMRTFVNSDIYNALPSNLKSAIIETSVVSGHGSTSGETNFVTTDKLYLLNPKEVYNSTLSSDTSYNHTRQLDYYAIHGVTTSSYSDAIKKYGSSAYYWWFRSPYSYDDSAFFCVESDGSLGTRITAFLRGVSPAFRIA